MIPIFRTAFEINSLPQPITYPGEILGVGSCFAQHMGAQLSHYKFRNVLNPTGIVFNPIACADALKWVWGMETWTPDRLLNHDDRWHSLDHHSSFSHNRKEELEARISSAFSQAKSIVKGIQTLVLTWGSAWVYTWLESGRVVTNCHKIPASSFEKRLLTVEEIVASYAPLITHIHKHSPACQIILTISPVRHWKDGVIQNQESKATLRLAIRALQEQFPALYYFPSYELMMDELRDYRFYEADMLHPNSTAISYIWDRFKQACIHPECYGLMDRIHKIQQALAHQPLNPEGEGYIKHTKKVLKWIETLESEEVWLNFEAEKRSLSG